ncbi:TauD/TfdA family dioxygenase [Micromonospora sp. WMMD980]|uniref:TauD/TfdA family dioxygenase n=1 Tax=Micromonospora sp. WMMD980 TaxID=3016088 RepID=UPI002417702B|nr:TauD/TfdA family dioxygenase [Micromonospora sp. WMMD980]MDG4801002.1 TauD/TfdA family dioxygenase [Micromonospora sp. WMMD980]
MRLLRVESLAKVGPDQVPSAIGRDGVILIRNSTADEVAAFLRGWTEPVDHPHQSVGGLTVITPHHRIERAESEAGFTRSALHPHTDRSVQAEPPSVLAALMTSPSRSGGVTTLVDGARVLTRLRHHFDDSTLVELRLRPADGSVERPVIEVAASLTRLRYRDDQVAAPRGRPDVLKRLRRLIIEETLTLELAAGEGYLVHNHRFLHGRTAFTGGRRLVRFLARFTPDHPYAWLNRGFSIASS